MSLITKTKYVCHGLISPHVNFHVNRLLGTIYLLVQKLQVGRKGKRAIV